MKSNVTMNISERCALLINLGKSLQNLSELSLSETIMRAELENQWFTVENIRLSFSAIRDQFLTKEALESVVNFYKIDDNIAQKKVGLVLAGNIPIVGWHDVMCTFLTGHISQIKYSAKDKVLMSWMINKMISLDERANQYFEIVEKLQNYDAAIATGSNNTATHFEYYFSHVPNIIRRNRNSVAVVTGNEKVEDIISLGIDVFTYFGLGCRNVSAILIPVDYDVTFLFEAWEDHRDLINHNKYKNNHDYNVALYLLNLEKFLHNEFLILKESEQIISRIATLHYIRYSTIADVRIWIKTHEKEIQCVVCTTELSGIETVRPGQSQCPSINTFADGEDTIQFLLGLS
jgi:hypothetical protein